MSKSSVLTLVRIAMARDAGIPGPGISRGRHAAPATAPTPQAIHLLIEVLDGLPPQHRDILRARAAGVTLASLASRAGVSTATMHNRARSAELALAEAMARRDLPEGMLWT